MGIEPEMAEGRAARGDAAVAPVELDFGLVCAPADRRWARRLRRAIAGMGMSADLADPGPDRDGDRSPPPDDGLKSFRALVPVFTSAAMADPGVKERWTTALADRGPGWPIFSVMLEDVAVPGLIAAGPRLDGRDRDARRIARELRELAGLRFDFFLSHSTGDKPWVLELERALGERRRTAFVDNRDIEGGMNWPGGLSDGLTRSRALVLVMTPASIASGWVAKEWRGFRSLYGPDRRPIYPILLEHVAIPAELKVIQYTEARHRDAGGVAEVLDGLLDGHLEKTRRLPPRRPNRSRWPALVASGLLPASLYLLWPWIFPTPTPTPTPGEIDYRAVIRELDDSEDAAAGAEAVNAKYRGQDYRVTIDGFVRSSNRAASYYDLVFDRDDVEPGYRKARCNMAPGTPFRDLSEGTPVRIAGRFGWINDLGFNLFDASLIDPAGEGR